MIATLVARQWIAIVLFGVAALAFAAAVVSKTVDEQHRALSAGGFFTAVGLLVMNT